MFSLPDGDDGIFDPDIRRWVNNPNALKRPVLSLRTMGLPTLMYDPVCQGSRAYIAVAGEVLGQISRPSRPSWQASV